ncbi:MAG TPA: hypothetical protein VN872_13665, partial [Candidatus Acidoferrum sp.]|nr:hypothetical protein [Candidatus Acidoferrum sp.]
HGQIESAFPNYGLHYERVTNQYGDNDEISPSTIVTPKYLARTLISMLLQAPDEARGRPDSFTENNYAKLFAKHSRPAMFANAVLVMRRVEKFVSVHVPIRNDQTNLKYYVAADVMCSALKKGHIQRGMLANLKLEKITDDLLNKSLERVKGIYDTLIANDDEEPDQIAKGKDMVSMLRQLLEAKYPMNETTKREARAGS